MIPIAPPQPPPSPAARELGERIADVIEKEREQNPRLVPGDIRAALRLAGAKHQPQRASDVARLASRLLGLASVLVFLFGWTRPEDDLVRGFLLVAGLIGFGTAVMIAIGSRRDSSAA